MPTPPTPTAEQVAAGDWEKKFFEKHGISDEKEKEAIRGRARVLAYDHARRKAEEAAETKAPGKWYEE